MARKESPGGNLAESSGPAGKQPAQDNGLSPWPETGDQRVAFLLDVRDDFEAGLLQDWVESRRPSSGPGHAFINLSDTRSGDWLDDVPDSGNGLWMQPLRVAWLPSPGKAGSRSLRDLFYGHMTKPGWLRRRWLAKHRPDRFAYVIGDGASLDELRERHSDDGSSLSEYVAGQALIALERSERSLRGARYKISRILQSEVFANADFQNQPLHAVAKDIVSRDGRNGDQQPDQRGKQSL